MLVAQAFIRFHVVPAWSKEHSARHTTERDVRAWIYSSRSMRAGEYHRFISIVLPTDL